MGDQDRWARQVIAYEDAYERRDGTWSFVRRNQQLCYGETGQVRVHARQR